MDRTGASFFTGPEISVRFDIVGYWHGVSDGTTTVYSTDHPEGLPVEDIGETWLVIANELDDGRFWATVCDGSSQYESLRDAPLMWMMQQLGLDVRNMRRPG